MIETYRKLWNDIADKSAIIQKIEKPKFKVERIKELLAELAEFDSFNLNEIELTENGIPVNENTDILEKWRFIGMSNRSFVEMEFWQDNIMDYWEE